MKYTHCGEDELLHNYCKYWSVLVLMQSVMHGGVCVTMYVGVQVNP